MPLHQHCTRSPLPLIRLCPNTSPLLPPLAPVPWPLPLPSPMLATGSTAFHLPRWVSTCRTRSSAAASAIGWEFPFTALPTPAQNATVLQIFLETIKLAVGKGDRILRHSAIRDVIFCAAQSAAMSQSVPNLILDSLSRPADVFLWPPRAALDVHVISPLQQQTIAEAAFSPGHSLQVAVHAAEAGIPPLSLPICGVRIHHLIVAEALGGHHHYRQLLKLLCACVASQVAILNGR